MAPDVTEPSWENRPVEEPAFASGRTERGVDLLRFSGRVIGGSPVAAGAPARAGRQGCGAGTGAAGRRGGGGRVPLDGVGTGAGGGAGRTGRGGRSRSPGLACGRRTTTPTRSSDPK